MNWETHLVDDIDFRALVEHNQPIEVSNSNLTANAGVEIHTLTGKRHNAIYDAKLKAIRQLNNNNPQFGDMKNRDLILYNDHLLNKDINTIVVDGFFGTGKTSIVCSHLVEGLMRDLAGKKEGIEIAYLAKPHVGVGQGYGFLPGDLHEKMAEEFKSYTQYFERFGNPGLADFLMMRKIDEQPGFNKRKLPAHLREDPLDRKDLVVPKLELLPFEYLRGRDIPVGWVVLDEAQNTNTKEMVTFLSRPNDPAKLIISGDSTSTQIDKRGNTSKENGLQFAKDLFKDKKYAGYVELQTIQHILRGERTRDLFRYLKGIL